MQRRPLLSGLALSALLVPLSVAVPGDDGAKAELTALVETLFSDVANEVTYECQCEEGACTPETCNLSKSPRAQLTGWFGKGPEAVAAFQPIAVEAIRADSTTPEQGWALIGVLLESRNSAVVPVGEAMFEASPDRFCSDCLLGFCEMGSEELVDPLTSKVEAGEANVSAAAFVALKADSSVAKKILKKAQAADVTEAKGAFDALLAGYVLEKLGREGALHDARIKVHDATIAALDADDLPRARGLALTAAVLDRGTRSKKAYFSLLGVQCMNEIEAAASYDKLATADEIFDLIQEVTPIG